MAAQKINEAHEHIAKAEKCHSVCKVCLQQFWRAKETRECPVCKRRSSRDDPPINLALKNISKSFLKERNERRSSGSEEICSLHATKFKFFCLEDKQPVCVVCRDSHTHAYHTFRPIGEVASSCKDMKKMPEAIQLIEKASVMYVENGTSGTAGIALDRAGKLVESIDLEKAVDLYQKAASVFENEDRLRQAAELLGKSSRLLVRLRRLDEAAVSLQKEKNMYKEIENYPTCFKKTIAQVLVHLHRGDFVAADKCVRESYSLPGFSGSEDCVSMETLLAAYDEQDEDQLARVCNSPLLKYMDNDYAKLAISLRVPGGGGGKKKKPPVAPQEGSAGPPAEEDDYEGGLC
ncbi:Gamma-soluble NSF attachment protein [Anabarilius grahami]|uniref:Gamma-soluble NSF attachment protein n=1 Tax=Anabarilius grahami TaxID=495550 RepID=A0A3N0Z015_ANAGA|nr:Gamma-soluble NSF attachment protein [Anabarilius grahami]